MKPNTYCDDLSTTRLLRDYEATFPRPIQRDNVVIYFFAAILVSLCWGWGISTVLPDDFTDTGVGCEDDCLEPAEVEAITWQA